MDPYEMQADGIEGPFAESKVAIGGHWIIQVRTREEAIECKPAAHVRQRELMDCLRFGEWDSVAAATEQRAASLLRAIVREWWFQPCFANPSAYLSRRFIVRPLSQR